MNDNFFSSQSVQNLLQQFQNQIAAEFISIFKTTAIFIWVRFWPYIIGFVGVIIAGIILQILMLKGGRENLLPPWFNRLVGSFIFLVFSVLIGFISYKIWGPKVIDEIWFALFGAIAFPLTWIFLRVIGFWYY